MKVLSLFDGMSCGQIALRQLMLLNGFENLRIDTYYASEIDKYAIAQTKHNFPDTVQLGDVERWREWNIDWEHLDLVMGGSPCQGFSCAGKRLAFDDPRSRLFFVFAEILDYARSRNPRIKFLLENVNMKKEYLHIISKRVGVVPVKINSALVSAQNRNRWYWTDIRTRQEGFFGEVYSDIPQPEDRGIFLRDIFEPIVDEKYYLPDKSVRKLLEHKKRNDEAGNGFGKTFHNPDGKTSALKVGGRRADSSTQAHATVAVNKSTPIVSAAGMGGGHVPMIMQPPRGKNNEGFHAEEVPTLSTNEMEQNNILVLGNIYDNGHNSQAGRVYSIEGKSTTLRGEAGGGGGKTGLYLVDVPVVHNMMPRSGDPKKGGTGHLTRTNGKTYCLDTGQTNAVEILIIQYMLGKSKEFQRSKRDSKSFCLDTSDKRGFEINGKIRRLTPTECARLQTIPEWYEWICSKTQQYRMLGNGWTVEVIKHILSYGDWNQ